MNCQAIGSFSVTSGQATHFLDKIMIFHDGFACRRFDITAEGLSGGVEMAGSVIIGLPQGQFPEFEREHTVEDWQQILRQILTPNDLSELNQQLGHTMRERTYFFLRTTADHKATIETQPPYKTKSGKRLWVEGLGRDTPPDPDWMAPDPYHDKPECD